MARIFLQRLLMVLSLILAMAWWPGQGSAQTDYRLGAADVIRLTVFGEPDLSGEFKLDGNGMISLPLIGSLKVGGLSLREAEQQIAHALQDGYLLDPKISIEVASARPFFVMGEVQQPGSYHFVEGMTVLQAVALSGGFTYRANQKTILITRAGAQQESIEADVTAAVMPGDVIKVKERFF